MLAAYQKVAPRRSVNLGMRRPTQQHTGDWIAT
jgi:hypothetical protein